MKKGFTLIELLAVIIILAIIALITVPIILNVVNDARKSSAEDKAWGTINSVKLHYTEQTKKNLGESKLPYEVHFTSDKKNDKGVKMSGDIPTNGNVIIKDDGVVTATCLKFDKYYCSTDDSGTKMNCNNKCSGMPSSEETLEKLNQDVVSTGDGLYKDPVDNGRYVFRGVSPRGYIKFNNELWRILAVESDGTIKIIRNDSIPDSYLKFAFDPGYRTLISGLKGANSVEGTRYTNVKTDYCYYNSGFQSSYYGCNAWGSKTTTMDSHGNYVTKMPKEVGGETYDLPEKEAFINTYLNTTYYNNLTAASKVQITEHVFYIGPVALDSSGSLAKEIQQEKAYTWKGKIGMLNITDYVKSTLTSECSNIYSGNQNGDNPCRKNNYLFRGLVVSLSPKSDKNFATTVWTGYYDDGGLDAKTFISDQTQIRPVVFLKSTVTLSGEGTETNPYKIS